MDGGHSCQREQDAEAGRHGVPGRQYALKRITVTEAGEKEGEEARSRVLKGGGNMCSGIRPTRIHTVVLPLPSCILLAL